MLWKKKRKGNKQAKLRSRWGHGIFVGVRKKSGELWVATKTGEVRSVRAVKRILEEERWSEDCVRWMRGTLWHKYRDDPEEDGEIPEGKAVEVEEDGENKGRRRRSDGEDARGEAQRVPDKKRRCGEAGLYERMRGMHELVQRWGKASAYGYVQREVQGGDEGPAESEESTGTDGRV